MKRINILRWSLLALFLLGWEALRRLDIVPGMLLASPTEIYQAWHDAGPDFLAAFRLTVIEIAISLVIACSLGILMGLFAGSSARRAAIIGPLLSSLFAIPLITLYPLFMVWAGIGPPSKVLFAVVSGVLPIAINTMTGVRMLDSKYIVLGRSVGASRAQIIYKVLVPLAMPSVISGLRIGTSLVVIGVVVAEMLASLGGLGFYISYHRTLFNTGHVYLGILLALVCVVFVNWALSRLEKHFDKWRSLEMGS